MIDAVQSGVGGDNSWDAGGRPMPQYRIALKPIRYSFGLSPFSGGGASSGKATPAAAASLQ